MRRLVLAGAIAVGLWSGLPAAFVAASSTAIQSAALTAQGSAFMTCVRATAGAPHRTTLSEARRCEVGLPEIDRSQVATTRTLPHLFLVVDHSLAALEWTGIATPTDPANAAYAACDNTWAYPNPGWWFFYDGGSLNSAGYGNNCGYANMTGITVGWWCAPGRSASVTSGTADNNWNLTHYNINSALGWANFQFSGTVSDFWACRSFVDTNGAQNPSSYCS